MAKVPFGDTYDNQYQHKHREMALTLESCFRELRKHLLQIFGQRLDNQSQDICSQLHNLSTLSEFCSKGELYSIVLKLVGILEEVRLSCTRQQGQQLLTATKQNLLRLYKSQMKTTVDLLQFFDYLYALQLEPSSHFSFSQKEESEEDTENDELAEHKRLGSHAQQDPKELGRNRAKTNHSMNSQATIKTNKSVKILKLL